MSQSGRRQFLIFAAALGLTTPRELPLRADEVIE